MDGLGERRLFGRTSILGSHLLIGGIILTHRAGRTRDLDVAFEVYQMLAGRWGWDGGA
jgi:hypothetical protein